MFDAETVSKFFKIVVADLLLAGDNALVIALATRNLGPKDQFWGRMIGTGGAVALRVLFISIISLMMQVRFIHLIGGLLLLWIAWSLVQPQDENQSESEGKHATSLKHAIWMIIAADITMSFDNVVAIANIAKGDTLLVVFGLLLSIPLVVWGSSLISSLMNRHRWIVWFGGAVLGHVAGGIILHDPSVLGWMGVNITADTAKDAVDSAVHGHALAEWTSATVPWALAAVLFLIGWWLSGHPKDLSEPDKK